MHVFFTPLIQPDMQAFLLDEDESKHAVRVLRLQVGEEVVLVDGRGGWFRAKIEDAHPKRVILSIVAYEPDFDRRGYYFHLAIAPTKNMDRIEWLLEKATEVGLDEVSFLLCDRSERKDVNIARLERVMVAAMKQSLKATLPKINAVTKFSSFVDQPRQEQGFIAHCEPGDKVFLSERLGAGQGACVLIGPEGDFSPEEIALAESAGFQPLSLGKSRLRTETAGLIACMEAAIIQRVP